jgi:hypothetical protein
VKRFGAIAVLALALVLVGCGGTYIDDRENFERALRFQRPKDVQLVHSLYWQSSHFTEEYCYFLELQPSQGSGILQTLTAEKEVAPVTDTAQEAPPALAMERPEWFAPGPRSGYELWASTNRFRTFGVMRNKQDGRIFVYGQVL